MKDDKFKYYACDLGMLLKEKAMEAKNIKNHSLKTGGDDYETGYLMAFYEVIDLMKQLAMTFNIDQKDVGLADIDAEEDLL